MALLTAKVTWLLEDFGVSVTTPTTLLSGAISIARDPVKHELTKHIDVDASYVRVGVQGQVIALQDVSSELQLADFFTKAQTRAQHGFYVSNSVLWIHHEFEGKERGGVVSDIFMIGLWPHAYWPFVSHMYMYI
uniref:Uncharacterized protein n=1 Tax=Avena sativa TaxID=4498 RepID=A0ACD5ZZZ7_AVESA